MKKKVFLSSILCLMCVSCITQPDHKVDPILNNDPFNMYKPWWVTNNVEGGIISVESNNVDEVQSE